MEKSLWQKYNNIKENNKINKNIKTDVLIIGAGITGITTAYNLINNKLDVTIVDRGKVFNDVTSKSTGKITYLQELKYQDICNIYNYETAKLYYESQKDAISILKRNIKENKINCDLERAESIVFTMNENEIPKFKLEEKILKSLNVKFLKKTNLIKDDKIKYLISVKNTYVFNPVKYLKGLLKKIKKSNNVKVFEKSLATKIRKDKDFYTVIVNGYSVETKKIVIACNYPFFTIPGFIPFKTYLKRSYITATKVINYKNLNGISIDKNVLSFRYYKENNSKYFIFLTNSSKISDKLNYEKNYMENVLKSKKITDKLPSYKWSNIDVMTNDFLPIIGKISDDISNVFIATGYNAWGMTNGTIAGEILSDLVRGKKNKYENIFNPTRKINLKSAKNLLINTISSSSKAYITNFFIKNPSWYNKKAIVIKENNKRIGIYIDEDGIEHKVSNICPHLKCFLTFNSVDKTWDCPCHASRFDIDGNSIKGPSCYNIKIDKTK